MNTELPQRPHRTPAPRAARALLALTAATLPAGFGLQAQAPPPPKEFVACYVPVVGAVYRIKEPGILQKCLYGHVQFSWSEATGGGVTSHGALSGLANDDHPQYLLGDGTRALTGDLGLGGKKLTNLAAATANGDAVRFEQAIKAGDAAGGDLSGAFPNASVVKLQGTDVAATAPTTGQVLAYNGAAWAPTTGGSGGVTAHAALTGLANDDHTQYLLSDGVRATMNGFAVTGTLGTGALPTSGAGTRMLWFPARAAFRVGHATATQWDLGQIGDFSIAMGLSTTASGRVATATGNNTTASGIAATAMGINTTASGTAATAMGAGSIASGDNATAMGNNATASGIAATAMGNNATASGAEATAMGNNTTASSTAAVAMGNNTTASGSEATAMGKRSIASGMAATAMGNNTTASNTAAVAMGNNTTASGSEATAMGLGSIASGGHAVAAGHSTTASGDNSFAVGFGTTAAGNSSMAMGALASTGAHPGVFVFGDFSTLGGSGAVVTAGADNEFVARAAGGFRFRTAADLSTGCNLPAGSGVFSCTSSRLTKENFAPLDPESVLGTLAGLSIQSWNYTAESAHVRHAGPTAEDFYAAFQLGTDSTAIGTIDETGVSLIAIQALGARTALLKRENEALRAALARLEDLVRQIAGSR